MNRCSSWAPCGAVVVACAIMCPQSLAGECVSPPNEDCDGAVVLNSGDLPFSVTAPLGCVNDIVDKPYFDIFYRYDCSVTADHIFDMCDSDGDTYIRIYTGACGWTGGVEFAVGDDECPGSPPNADPLIVVPLEAGTTYWIELGTWRDQPPWAPPPNSPYNFSLSIAGAQSPSSCDGTGLPTTMVAAPQNSADGNGLGAVAGLFRISKFEITNRQYVDFLNNVAATDPNGLFNEDMTDSDRGGIIRGGTVGTFVYFVKQSFGDKPVNFVGWPDAARFCNWLHNGQPVGPQDATTTERGAYDMSVANDAITRESAAQFYLPTHDEWYKSAYYDPDTANYWSYGTQSNVEPVQATADADGNVANPGISVANFQGGADWNGENGNVTTVGSTTSESPWGAFDMAGNVMDMTETLGTPIPPNPPGQPDPLPTRIARGGDFASPGIIMSSSSGFAIDLNMVAEAANVGFRVAATVCLGDFDGDNDVDENDVEAFGVCLNAAPMDPIDPTCTPGDFDGNGVVDCTDWAALLGAWTGIDDPPLGAFCAPIPAVSTWGAGILALSLLISATVVLRRCRPV